MLSFPKQYINRIQAISEQKKQNETKQQESIKLYEQLAKQKHSKQVKPPAD
jgi:hypothetical protein